MNLNVILNPLKKVSEPNQKHRVHNLLRSEEWYKEAVDVRNVRIFENQLFKIGSDF